MTKSANVGKEQERHIVRHAKANGFPGADRIIRTGAGPNYSVRPDEGDIWLCPGIIIQSKRLSPPNRAERAVAGWLDETRAQCIAAGADYGVLIVRREGTADVGEWWAWLCVADVIRLHSGTRIALFNWARTARMPVRLTVADAYILLRSSGYGTPIAETSDWVDEL